MPDVGAALSKKTMGLPRWALGAGVVGAIGLGLYLRSRSAGAAATTAATDTTGTTTTGATGTTGTDTSGLATADQIDALQQTLSDLPSELAASLGTTTPGDIQPWGPGVDNPGGGVTASGGSGVFTKNPATGGTSVVRKFAPTVKTGSAARVSKTNVNKAKGRTPPRKHPKPTPKPVKKANKLVGRLKPKPKRKAPAKKPAATVHSQNLGTFSGLAKLRAASQATHRNASTMPAMHRVAPKPKRRRK